MNFPRIEKLKHEYTDQYVVVEGGRPEHSRFQGLVGRVKTVNMSGRALVQFEGRGDMGWYDVELDYLKVVDPPQPKPAPAKPAPKAAAGKAAPAQKLETPEKPAEAPPAPAEPKPSPLEVARKEKEEQAKKAGPPPTPGDPGAEGPAKSK